MRGMFQSSSTASGILSRQHSRACSPSSASAISNSSPSRMRRATFRMTLESSTTKQFFIAHSLLDPLTAPPSRFSQTFSCRLRLRSDVEHAIDVEHDQQAAFQAVHAGRDAGEIALEIDGIVLAAIGGELQHLANCVGQQAVMFAPAL